MRWILAMAAVFLFGSSRGFSGTELEAETLLTVCDSLVRIEELLVVLLAVQCFAVGLLLWRLFVLSKSQRNIL